MINPIGSTNRIAYTYRLTEPELADLRRDIETWLLPVLLPSNVPNEKIPKVTELPEMNQMLFMLSTTFLRELGGRIH